jgi:hypothetical protein
MPCQSCDCPRYARRGSLGPYGSALVRVPSARRAFKRRRASTACETRRDPPSRSNSPRLRAAKVSSVHLIRCLGPSHPPVGSARNEYENPQVFSEIGTRPPGRWCNAGRNTAPAPQSKPVTRASRLVAQTAPLVAFGLGSRILAAGPAHNRLYSYYRRQCGRRPKLNRQIPADKVPSCLDGRPNWRGSPSSAVRPCFSVWGLAA